MSDTYTPKFVTVPLTPTDLLMIGEALVQLRNVYNGDTAKPIVALASAMPTFKSLVLDISSVDSINKHATADLTLKAQVDQLTLLLDRLHNAFLAHPHLLGDHNE